MNAGIGLIGCGVISAAYLRTLTRAAGARVVAVADMDLARASARAEEFGVPLALGVDELLARDDIDLVIDLTVPTAHAEINRRGLEAGKSVHSEKPLTTTAAEALALVRLAEERGLSLGGAPDTFLGAGLQTTMAVLSEGLIGQPFAAVAHLVTAGPERWHPDPAFFYRDGGGPLLDLGPYHLTALVAMFGPVASVSAEAGRKFEQRTIAQGPHAGQRVPVEVPTHVTLLLRFASGFLATLLTSFDVDATELPRFEVFGSEGTLSVPDPNGFGGLLRLRRHGDAAWQEVPLRPGFTDEARGIGALELLQARATGRAPRASGELAAHVLEVMEAGLRAADEGRRVEVHSRPAKPALLGAEDLTALGWVGAA